MIVPAALRVPRATALGRRLYWLGYATLVATLIALYVTMLAMGHRLGISVDYACFRAAALLVMHGDSPYNVAHLWSMENALYNAPLHLPHGAPPYYKFDPYVNPALFAWALIPLARLPFLPGYAIFAAICVALAGAGAWLTVSALGWTARRSLAVGIALLCPYVFLTAWYGQQSTMLLCAFGGALYLLRRRHAGTAGALLALAWIKPHLLVPVALAIPFLLPPRAARRVYGGFAVATLCGVALTVLTTGAGSIGAWVHTLLGYTGHVDAIQGYLPSLSGAAWLLAPRPWNALLAAALTALGLAVLALAVVWSRRVGLAVPIAASVLLACWLLFTPYAHAHDDVLLLPALAVAWGPNGINGGRVLPALSLWTVSTVSLSFLLPEPWKLLGVLPALVVLAAASMECRRRACGT